MESSEPLPSSSRILSTGAETDRRDLMAAACGVRTARDATVAVASAAPGLGLRWTPRKSEGRGFDDEEAPLLEKVLATRPMRISSGAGMGTRMRKATARAQRQVLVLGRGPASGCWCWVCGWTPQSRSRSRSLRRRGGRAGRRRLRWRNERGRKERWFF